MPSYRLSALVMSVAAHLVAGGAIIAHAGRPAADSASVPSVMTVHLVSLDTPVNAGGAGKPPPEARDESKVKPPDTVAVAADQPIVEQPLFPVPDAETRYFPARELTVRPRVTVDVRPDIRITGVPSQTVILRLFINESGDIDRVVTEQSFLPEELAGQINDAFAKLKFQPGTIGDTPVKSQMKIEVRLDDERTAPQ